MKNYLSLIHTAHEKLLEDFRKSQQANFFLDKRTIRQIIQYLEQLRMNSKENPIEPGKILMASLHTDAVLYETLKIMRNALESPENPVNILPFINDLEFDVGDCVWNFILKILQGGK